jgi:formylglycine-generating enzyme required for sulfatase activity
LRAGLLPRLKRDDRHFLPLPTIRPERSAINGETGLLRALEDVFKSFGIVTTRSKLRAAIEGGALTLGPLLKALADKATPSTLEADAKPQPRTLIVSVDQGEELFLAEGQDEAQAFLALLHDLLIQDEPVVIAVFTIRSDNYERLQLAKELEGVRQETLSLPPMPKGSYAEVIKGPALRLEGTERSLEVEDTLVNTLLTDIEAGGAKDALPLLAFTLERLYAEHGGDGDLTAAEYRSLGGIMGSIEAAVERALKAADADPAIPRDRIARLALLRRGLIPWLAGIDPDTGAPRRRVARLSEIPSEARPMIQHLVEQRLLATDVANDTGENTIEPAHEALLRQWGLLQGWLTEDAGLLAVLEGVKRASRDWAANAKNVAWLAHATDRLAAAERLQERPDLATNLEPTDREYLAACRKVEAVLRAKTQRVRALIYVLLVGIIGSLVGTIEKEPIKEEFNWFTVMRPYRVANFDPYVLKPDAERALKPLASFRECAKDCPEMIVIPAGKFTMGSPATEADRDKNEGPQHEVTISTPFAVSRFDVTFADWHACASVGGCPDADPRIYQGDAWPATNVSPDEARQYVAWLSNMTGEHYHLLTEAEWEYAARAGTTTAYYWGDEIGVGNANCIGCGGEWDNKLRSPVGSFGPNAFGLYDMAGNVWQWVQDCYTSSYHYVQTDGSASPLCDDSAFTMVRGGSSRSGPERLRSASRSYNFSYVRSLDVGFRVGRTLTP